MNLPPPPSAPDFENIPAPASEGERHEADVLKRRNHFSWKNFGGEGFLVSVAVHLLVLIAGLFWVINAWKKPVRPPPPGFEIGGGPKGDKGKPSVTKAKPRPSVIMKLPSRIVSKRENAELTLPSTPAPSATFATNLSGDGLPKNLGNDSGPNGGGPGFGPGSKKGFTGIPDFGLKNLSNGFVGTYYDVKYLRQPDSNGKLQPSDLWQSPPTWHSQDNISYEAAFPGKSGDKTPDADRYYKLIGRIADGDSAESVLAKYFVSPTRLTASQVWIKTTPSGKSPEAFEVGDKCAAHYWVVSYRAKISPPSTGRWRFVGAGDDVMVCKINGKPALSWFWWLNKSYLHQVWEGAPRGTKPIDKTKLRHYPGLGGYGAPGAPGVSGWVDMKKGSWYDCEIVIGDWGGAFSGFLLCEKEGETYENAGGVPLIPVFRTSDEMPAAPGPNLPPFAKDSPIWGVKSPVAERVR